MFELKKQVVVVGGGPAGMQTAIYTASEGLSTVVIEKDKVGGQIRQTPKLENFLGQSSKGVSGPQFAKKMKAQAKALGVEFVSGDVTNIRPRDIVGKTSKGKSFAISGKVSVIATGATWRKPDAIGAERYLGKSFFYGPFMCMKVKKGQTYNVVGGGNSSGQAIIDLLEHAEHVNVVAGSGLDKMASYLRDRIESAKNVRVVSGCKLREVYEDGIETTTRTTLFGNATFFAGGTVPNSDFAIGVLSRDNKGFIRTNQDLRTNRRDIFAIGDVRSGRLRRSVSNAVADANNVIPQILEQLDQTDKAGLSSSF